ncbi:MAG: DUF1292 domain-containing protein [Ruminococcaceae bacterium]|nr:DUF1292 domain-containing protein [Oscillospiraceae bacterium]
MSEEYGSDFITITDDEGNAYQLEHLDTLEIDGVYYLAFLPADIDEDDERFGFIIMKQEEENGESYLVVPPDEEADFAYQRFMERLFADELEEGEEEAE